MVGIAFGETIETVGREHEPEATAVVTSISEAGVVDREPSDAACTATFFLQVIAIAMIVA